MYSYLFFILLFVSLIFAYIAYKKNKKSYLFVSIIILSILTGLRGKNVGIDTLSYYNAFENHFPLSWQFREEGFRYLSNLLMSIFNNPSILFLIYSTLIILLITLRLWDYRKCCNFFLMYTLFILIYLFSTMNVMRQFITIAIIFYSTKLLDKKKYLLYFIIVLLMGNIHRSALLTLCIPIVYMWNNFSTKNKFLFIIPLISISIFGSIYVYNYEYNHILNYFSSNNLINNLNITFLYRIFIFVISFLLFKSNKKIVLNHSDSTNSIKVTKNEKDTETINISSKLYLMGLVLSSTGMFFKYMDRLGFYYLLFEVIYWGYLSKSSKNNTFNTIMILIYGIYVFVYEIIFNGSGIFPYTFY